MRVNPQRASQFRPRPVAILPELYDGIVCHCADSSRVYMRILTQTARLGAKKGRRGPDSV